MDSPFCPSPQNLSSHSFLCLPYHLSTFTSSLNTYKQTQPNFSKTTTGFLQIYLLLSFSYIHSQLPYISIPLFQRYKRLGKLCQCKCRSQPPFLPCTRQTTPQAKKSATILTANFYPHASWGETNLSDCKYQWWNFTACRGLWCMLIAVLSNHRRVPRIPRKHSITKRGATSHRA